MINTILNVKIRTRLLVIFMMVVLLSIVPISVINFQTTRAALTTTAEQSLLADAHQTATTLEAFIGSVLDSVRTEAQIPAIERYVAVPPAQRNPSPEATEAINVIKNLRLRDPRNIESYTIVDATGQIIASTESVSSLDLSQQPYVQEPLRTNAPYISSVQRDPASPANVVYFSNPIRNGAGNALGVLVVRYNATVLQDIVAKNTQLANNQTSIMVLDENNVYLAHSLRPEYVLRPISPLDPALQQQLSQAFRLADMPPDQLSTNETEFAQRLSQAASTPVFQAGSTQQGIAQNQYAVVPVANTAWHVAVARPLASFLAPIAAQGRSTVVISLALLAFAAMLAFVGARHITDPLNKLTHAVQRLQTGDLSAQVNVVGNDEFSTLGNAFNTMAQDLQQLVGNLEGQVAERTSALQQTLQQQADQALALQQALDSQAQLNTLVLQLAAPVMPIREGVLVIPLSGFADMQHIQQSLDNVLLEIEHQRADVAIIDITGIPVIDTALAASILNTAEAAHLLGSQLILVGIRPEVAQTLVGLGVNFKRIKTWATLQQALESISTHQV